MIERVVYTDNNDQDIVRFISGARQARSLEWDSDRPRGQAAIIPGSVVFDRTLSRGEIYNS